MMLIGRCLSSFSLGSSPFRLPFLRHNSQSPFTCDPYYSPQSRNCIEFSINEDLRKINPELLSYVNFRPENPSFSHQPQQTLLNTQEWVQLFVANRDLEQMDIENLLIEKNIPWKKILCDRDYVLNRSAYWWIHLSSEEEVRKVLSHKPLTPFIFAQWSPVISEDEKRTLQLAFDSPFISENNHKKLVIKNIPTRVSSIEGLLHRFEVPSLISIVYYRRSRNKGKALVEFENASQLFACFLKNFDPSVLEAKLRLEKF